MKKTVLILIIISIISKLSGLLREIILSFFYGSSSITDAFVISQTVPAVIFSFIGAAIATSYIPIYTKIQEKSEEDAIGFTNNLVNGLVFLNLTFILLGIVFAPQIVYLFASGFEGETLSLAIFFTRVSIFGILFTSLVHLYKSLAQIQGYYAITAFVSIPMNFLSILAIYLSYKYNLWLMAVGSVIAIGSQLLLLYSKINKKGYKYRYYFNIKDNYLKQMIMIGLPVVIGVAVNDINVLVDRTIASNISIGGISALNYADKLNRMIYGIFVVSISTSMYPLISKMAVKNNLQELKVKISESLNAVSLLIIPSTIGFMTFAQQIVTLVFGRGAFDYTASIMTTSAFYYYSIGMLGVGIREILSKVFYSLGDTVTPIKNAIIGVTVNIILNIILAKYIGIGGLALATSIAATFTAILLFVSLRKKIGPFGMKQISISFLKVLCASLIMGVLAKLSFNYLTTFLLQNLSLLIAIGVGAVSYFVIIYFMKIEDVDIIVEAIKKKLGRGAA